MTSFHHTFYESGIKDHPGQKEVKEFAKRIERLFPQKEPIGNIRWSTRYLREHFRCPECISKSKHPNKEKVKRETKFCEKCFNQNVEVKGFDFKIKFQVNIIFHSLFIIYIPLQEIFVY
mgnify:CR=1 FL=1